MHELLQKEIIEKEIKTLDSQMSNGLKLLNLVVAI
jgi:hypothetical protein